MKLKKNQCRYCTKGIKTLKMQMLLLIYSCENVIHVVIREVCNIFFVLSSVYTIFVTFVFHSHVIE